MTNDSHLFPPRPWWEAQGYRPDEYCRWLKGLWHEGRPAGPRWEMEPGVILSVDGTAWIHEDEIEDVALPLYEGRMIGQFDFSQKGWVRGKGRSAVWREIPWEAKVIEPQFLVPLAAFRTFRENRGLDVERHLSRIGFIDVASATNIRSMLSTPLHAVPCGNTVPVLESAQRPGGSAWLAAVLNSFCYDFALRARLGGLHLNWFVVDETPVQARKTWTASSVVLHACQLSLCHQCFAALWSDLGFALTRAWRHLWAVTKHERLRLRCLLDAVMAELYGLDWDDLAWILRECDYPVEMLRDTAFTRTLDPKGFWRVDKDKDPELRHTVLTLVAFRDLKQLIASEGDRDRGIEAFCALNNGEGWMLPETLRLADLGLGHDERAKRAQPVRERLGERFLSWQLEATPEESWRECRLHARNFLGEEGYKKLMKELDAARGDKADGLSATPTEEARSEASEVSGEAEWPALAAESHPPYEAGTVVGSTQLTLFPSGQKNLFGGNAAGIPSKRNRRRR